MVAKSFFPSLPLMRNLTAFVLAKAIRATNQSKRNEAALGEARGLMSVVWVAGGWGGVGIERRGRETGRWEGRHVWTFENLMRM